MSDTSCTSTMNLFGTTPPPTDVVLFTLESGNDANAALTYARRDSDSENWTAVFMFVRSPGAASVEDGSREYIYKKQKEVGYS